MLRARLDVSRAGIWWSCTDIREIRYASPTRMPIFLRNPILPYSHSCAAHKCVNITFLRVSNINRVCIRFIIFPSVFQIRGLFSGGDGNGGIKKLSSRILYLFFSSRAKEQAGGSQCQVKREVFWDASKCLHLILIIPLLFLSNKLIVRIFSSRTYQHPCIEKWLRNNSVCETTTRMINAFSIHLNAPLSPKRDIGAASMHRLIVQCLRIVAIVAD